MEENQNVIVDHIIRNWDDTPTIIDGKIKEGCTFDNTLIEGWGTMIVDKDFVNFVDASISSYEPVNDLFQVLTDIQTMVVNYFYSNNQNDNSRAETYDKNYVKDEDGMIIGTNISSLRGKNIAECSEKSLAGYMLLEKMRDTGKMKRKAELFLSTLKTETSSSEPHAFLVINGNNSEYPTKHILFDINNISKISVDDKEYNTVGVFTLTDEEYDNLKEGIMVSPKSLYEVISDEYKEIGEKRTFGSKEKTRTL